MAARKMRFLLVFSLLVAGIALSVFSYDIKAKKSPSAGLESEFFALIRKKRASTIQFTAEEKNTAVSKHNEYRSIVEPTASNMIQLVWNSGLASLAESYSKQCLYQHNPDRAAEGYVYVGENIFIRSNEQEAAAALENAITSWDNEKNLYDYDTDGCTGVCGHYTQSVWAETEAVGCGITTCSDINVNGQVWPVGQLVVCNYGEGGNFVGAKPFKSGAPCSECPNSNYTCSENLCVQPSSAQNLYLHVGLILFSFLAAFCCTYSM